VFGILAILAVVLTWPAAAFAQPSSEPPPAPIEYPSVAAALEGLRAKSGVRVSDQDGWTIIDDSANFNFWSFAPAGHPAYPAAIRRKIVRRGDDFLVDMAVLCEASKSACDQLVAEFQILNNRIRQSLAKPPAR
jgi:hypothetical protein